jgi:membrane protease YdiL (CAAX protease family)
MDTAPLSPLPVPPGAPDWTSGPARSGKTPLWLWVAAIALLAVNVALQRPETLTPAQLSDLETGKTVEPPTGGPDLALGKLAFAQQGKTVMGVGVGDIVVGQYEAFAESSDFAQDKFRVAVVLGKLGHADRMESWFTRLEKTIDAASVLREDMRTVRGLVTDDRSAGAPEPTAVKELEERHGWFGRLAQDDGSAGGAIDQAKKDGERLAAVGLKYLALQATFFVSGLGVLVVLVALAITGRVKPYPTDWRAGVERGFSPRVWLEAVSLFLLGFLGLKMTVLVMGLGGVPQSALIWATLLMPWLLLPTVMWGRMRGLSGQELRGQLGWHMGRGFFREVITGMAAYLGMIPILIAVTVVIMVFYAIFGLKPPQVADRVFELGAGRGIELFATFALVVAWAPIVEEAVFRGALYRFVRTRGGMLAAVAVSAGAFAIMHAYAVPQLVAVGTLGVGFAFLREWRGSLIASMTAHFLQNAVVFTFVSQIAPLIGA